MSPGGIFSSQGIVSPHVPPLARATAEGPWLGQRGSIKGGCQEGDVLGSILGRARICNALATVANLVLDALAIFIFE